MFCAQVPYNINILLDYVHKSKVIYISLILNQGFSVVMQHLHPMFLSIHYKVTNLSSE